MLAGGCYIFYRNIDFDQLHFVREHGGMLKGISKHAWDSTVAQRAERVDGLYIAWADHACSSFVMEGKAEGYVYCCVCGVCGVCGWGLDHARRALMEPGHH